MTVQLPVQGIRFLYANGYMTVRPVSGSGGAAKGCLSLVRHANTVEARELTRHLGVAPLEFAGQICNRSEG